ncbi:TPA: AAA family ATPase [Streptococcus suis]|nr:AAA family ATPase [Streptococcus suis]
MGDVQQLERPSESFAQENNWMYFLKEKEDLFIVTGAANTKREIAKKVQSLWEVDVYLEGYSSITEDDFIDKVGREQLGEFGYFLLKQSKENKQGLTPNADVLSENMIGLSDFKNSIQHLKNYLDYQSNDLESHTKEPFFLIFNGQKGSGRKYALQYLERLFDLQAVDTHCSEYFLPKTDEKQFLVIYDYFKARSRPKLELFANINTKKENNICILITQSTEEAKKIEIELQEEYYNVNRIEFPPYTHDELVEIAIQLLVQRQIRIDKELVEEYIDKSSSIVNAKDIRRMVQRIHEYAVATNYCQENGVLDLGHFSLQQEQSIGDCGGAEKRLHQMIGLHSVKKLIRQQVAFEQLSKLRKERGYHVEESNGHLLFTGNPGTGKTEVARLYIEILYEHGLIAENKIVEVGRAELIGEYVGQTAPKIKKVFDSASGGVLFIDEAYSLIPQSERDFANEAIPTIIQEMENRRNEVVVIFAGYKDLMHNVIDTNPGLQSRISKIIHFEDYSVDELYEIFRMMLSNKGYSIESSCESALRSHFSSRVRNEHFGNGRYVRKLIEAILYQQATRVMERLGKRDLDETEMNVVIEADIKNAIQELSELESTQRLIGFGLQG